MEPETRSSGTAAQKEEQEKPSTTREGVSHSYIDREHPIGGQMSDIVRGLFLRTRLPWLLEHHARIPVLALFSFVNGCISIGIMAALAVVTHSPFIFPSLGPTAFLFFYTPTAPSASPRNTVIGHAIGVTAYAPPGQSRVRQIVSCRQWAASLPTACAATRRAHVPGVLPRQRVWSGNRPRRDQALRPCRFQHPAQSTR